MKNKKLFAILTLVCFLMTLVPGAAFAMPSAADSRLVIADEVNVDETVPVKVVLRDHIGTDAETAARVDDVRIMKNGVEVTDMAASSDLRAGKVIVNGTAYGMMFFNAGTYTVDVDYTALDPRTGAPYGDWEPIKGKPGDKVNADGYKLDADGNVCKKFVERTGYPYQATISSNEVKVLPEDDFTSRYHATVTSEDLSGIGTFLLANPVLDEGRTLTAVVGANTVQKTKINVSIADRTNHPVVGKTVKLNAPGLILSSNEVVTDEQGIASFTVSAKHAQRNLQINVSQDKFNFLIPVDVVTVNPAVNIEGADKIGPADLLGQTIGEANIAFDMYDERGNKVVPVAGIAGLQGWAKAYVSGTPAEGYSDFVKIVEQPAGSNIDSKDLYFDGERIRSNALDSTKRFKKEGTYVFEVALDNEHSARTVVEVKEMGNPVKVNIEYPTAVERGAFIAGPTSLTLVDANGVERDANILLDQIDLSADGDALVGFTATNGSFKVQADEKYVGSTIKVQAYWHNKLLGETSIKVAGKATRLNFDTNKANVNEPTKVGVNIVDEYGNDVTLGHSTYNQGNLLKALVNINYTVLDKPEGANVTLSTDRDDTIIRNLTKDGSFDMNFTCDKVGQVTVQATVKYSAIDQQGKTVTKYYTGTQVFNVGTPATGDVVVMSIGSHQIVINDKTATIDSEPIIKDCRTFVPFRALAEAFGAEVNYNDADRTITATLNGTTVVMTIGSNSYTVNGATKTMDVAPFITGDRTMVPVRFVAEAFGIEVIPTYNPDHTTADILFLL